MEVQAKIELNKKAKNKEKKKEEWQTSIHLFGVAYIRNSLGECFHFGKQKHTMRPALRQKVDK